MKVSTKIIGAFGCLVAIIGVTGVTGLIASGRLSDSIDYLSGPAWSTADGAMEGTIEMRTQFGLAQMFLAGSDEVTIGDISYAGSAAQEAFDRMTAAGLMDESIGRDFQQRWGKYQASLSSLLAAKADFEAAETAFETHTASFVRLGEALEEVGDGAVETLEENPEEAVTWSGGLNELWAAADGGMESSIGYLSQLYHLQRLLSGADRAEAVAALSEARSFHEEAMTEMLATGRFDVPPANSALGSGTLASLYRDAFGKHIALMDTLVSAYDRLDREKRAFSLASADLGEVVTKVEEAGDGAVEGQADAIAATKRFARAAAVLGMVIGAAFAVVAGFFTVRGVVGPIRQLSQRMKDIAEGDGDLTARVKDDSNDEVGELGRYFNAFVDNIRTVVREVGAASEDVAAASTETASSTQSISESISMQRQRVMEISSMMDEMSDTVSSVAQQASTAAQSAEGSGDAANTGGQMVSQTIESIRLVSESVQRGAATIKELSECADQIGQIITVIDDIADQTNLLALNAAIEAARAGEHGRGFAVVADEVRKLAERTTTSTKEVTDSIRMIQAKTSEAVEEITAGLGAVEGGVETATGAGASLGGIVRSTSEVAHMIATIAAAAEEQNASVNGISENVNAVTMSFAEFDEQVAQSAAAMESLSSRAERLRALVGRFRT